MQGWDPGDLGSSPSFVTDAVGDPAQGIPGLTRTLQVGAVSWVRLLEATGWTKGAQLPPVIPAQSLPVTASSAAWG